MQRGDASLDRNRVAVYSRTVPRDPGDGADWRSLYGEDTTMPQERSPGTRAEGSGSIGPGGWLLRAALALLLIVGIVSLVPSLRARIFDGAAGRTDETSGTPTAADLLPAPDTLRYDSIDVRFDSFEFELIADQPNGSIRVRTADVETASVQIRTRTGLESFFRLPNGMRVINRRGSVADYELVVPERVRIIRLYMGGRLFTQYVTRVEGNADRTFDLSERPAR